MPRYNDGTHEQMNLILKKEEMEALRQQAEKLGTDRTGYIKLVVKLDTATNIIKKLKES